MTLGQPALIHADAAISPGGSGGIVLQLGELAVKVNGEDRKLEAAPMLSGDTTLVPLRFIAEALGAAVTWEEATRTAVLETGGATVRLTVDAAAAIVNGQPKELAAAPLISGETLMVPLRIIGESFGREVGYDGVTKRISISAPSVQSEAMPEGGAATPTTGPEAAKETTTKTGEATGLKQLKHPQVMTFSGVLGMSNTSAYKSRLALVPFKKTLDMAVDRHNNVYLLHEEPSTYYQEYGTFLIDKIDPSFSDKVQGNRVFDGKFTFTYTTSGVERKFTSSEFVPEKLVYNEKTDKVYVYGKNRDKDYKFGGLLFEVFPDVALAASVPASSNTPLGGNFVTFRDDGTIYVSDIGSGEIFEIKPDGKAERYTFIKDGATPERKLQAIYKDGLIVYDSLDGKVRKYTPSATTVLSTIDAKEVYGMTDYKGRLYVATDDKVSEISTDGTVTPWLNMLDVNYMDGLYNQATKTMDPSPTKTGLIVSKPNEPKSNDPQDVMASRAGEMVTTRIYDFYPTKALKLRLFGFNREGQLWAFDRETHYIRSIQEQ